MLDVSFHTHGERPFRLQLLLLLASPHLLSCVNVYISNWNALGSMAKVSKQVVSSSYK